MQREMDLEKKGNGPEKRKKKRNRKRLTLILLKYLPVWDPAMPLLSNPLGTRFSDYRVTTYKLLFADSNSETF